MAAAAGAQSKTSLTTTVEFTGKLHRWKKNDASCIPGKSETGAALGVSASGGRPSGRSAGRARDTQASSLCRGSRGLCGLGLHRSVCRFARAPSEHDPLKAWKSGDQARGCQVLKPRLADRGADPHRADPHRGCHTVLTHTVLTFARQVNIGVAAANPLMALFMGYRAAKSIKAAKDAGTQIVEEAVEGGLKLVGDASCMPLPLHLSCRLDLWQAVAVLYMAGSESL